MNECLSVITRDKLSSELQDILSELTRCKSNQIKGTTKIIKDLGVDSFTALEIIVFVENKFDLKIHENDLFRIVTVDEMINVVFDLIKKRKRKGYKK